MLVPVLFVVKIFMASIIHAICFLSPDRAEQILCIHSFVATTSSVGIPWRVLVGWLTNPDWLPAFILLTEDLEMFVMVATVCRDNALPLLAGCARALTTAALHVFNHSFQCQSSVSKNTVEKTGDLFCFSGLTQFFSLL